jgi:hypothetical protein
LNVFSWSLLPVCVHANRLLRPCVHANKATELVHLFFTATSVQCIHMRIQHHGNIIFRFSVFPALRALTLNAKRSVANGLMKCKAIKYRRAYSVVKLPYTHIIFTKACVTCGKYSVYSQHTSLSLYSTSTQKALRNL